MPLTEEEQTDIILLAWSNTTHHVARTFNTMHRTQTAHDTVEKHNKKFKMVSSVAMQADLDDLR